MFFSNYKLYIIYPFLLIVYSEVFSINTNDTIFHNVEKGETLFSISKRYNVEVNDLKIWNDLENNNLSINQGIIILSVAKDNEFTKEEIPKTYEEKFPGIFKEEGFASSIQDTVQTTKYLALHKNAEVGTVLGVKNQMNGKQILVKVIGKLPDTGQNQKLLIRLSKKAFSQLEALDHIIPVEITVLKE